jgi:adenosylhomocysteine nucleosidase
VTRVLDWLLAKPALGEVPYEPNLLIFAGFAGALTDALKVGDVVLVDEVLDAHGGRWRTTWPATLPDGTWTPPLHRGRLLTVDHFTATATQKRELGARHEAAMVDMESAVFAARCTKAGVPFTCVRAISDTVDTTLSPALASLLDGGAVSPWRALKAIARQPSLIPEFWRLARDTRHASKQLGLALGELLTLTLPSD